METRTIYSQNSKRMGFREFSEVTTHEISSEFAKRLVEKEHDESGEDAVQPEG